MQVKHLHLKPKYTTIRQYVDASGLKWTALHENVVTLQRERRKQPHPRLPQRGGATADGQHGSET